MFGKALMNGRVMGCAYQDNSDSAGFGVNNGWVVGNGGGESHAVEKLSRSSQVGDCDNNVVNAACDSIEFAALSIAGKFDGCWFIT
jgi:hypothetical protein